MSELLPCPFCGNTPKGQTKQGGDDERHGYNFTMCIKCGCGVSIGRPSHHDKGGWCDDTGQAKAAVIAAWNSRAPQAAKEQPR